MVEQQEVLNLQCMIIVCVLIPLLGIMRSGYSQGRELCMCVCVCVCMHVHVCGGYGWGCRLLLVLDTCRCMLAAPA